MAASADNLLNAFNTGPPGALWEAPAHTGPVLTMSSLPPLRLISPQAPEEPPPSDDYLMALAAEGRTPAFVQLVRRYEGKLRGFCALLVQDENTAREVAQEVFLRIWERRAAYQPRGRFKQLLFTAARNECRSRFRRQRLRQFLGLEPSDAAEDAPRVSAALATEHPEEEGLANERMALVRRALGQLPEKFRVPLLLRFSEEMPYEEIAEVIGRTPSAARSRVHYGIKALQALLPEEVFS